MVLVLDTLQVAHGRRTCKILKVNANRQKAIRGSRTFFPKSIGRLREFSFSATKERLDRPAGMQTDPALTRESLLSCDDIRAYTDTRLVIVTGRMVHEVSRLLDLTGVEFWGCHGLECFTANGAYEIFDIDALQMQSIQKTGELLVSEGLGDLVEYKPGGVAIHWEDRESISGHVMRKVLRVWSALATSRRGLRLMPFD